MIAVTAKEMRRLDALAIRSGILSLTLMENAGRRVAEAAIRFLKRPSGKRVVVVAGKGNNGGDGLVAARYLKQRGARVEVLLLSGRDALRDDAKTNLERFERRKGIVRFPGRYDLKDLSKADLILDAIFGTGLSSEVAGEAAEAIEAINRSGKPVIAVDVPSGLDSDTGRIHVTAVRAALTVTFGFLKQGLLLYPGAECAGPVELADIGFPASVVKQADSRVSVLTPDWVATRLPSRPPDAHKGTFGHVAVVAGSVGKTGAGILTSLGALRIGAGRVTLAHPLSVAGDLAGRPWEIMTFPLAATVDQTISPLAIPSLVSFVSDKEAVAVGPGISTQPETVRLIQELIPQLTRPCVLDADGLNALDGKPELLKKARGPVVITPHPGEMARLLGTSTEAVQEDRISAIHQAAERSGAVVVLKGARSLIGTPSGDCRIVTTGNSGMATAGMGDVLTGVIAGLLAQGLGPMEAAAVGTHLHGLAGDLAFREVGPAGLIASDLLARLPNAVRLIQHPIEDSR
jgi:NAD(P)H-hydrate epimerase